MRNNTRYIKNIEVSKLSFGAILYDYNAAYIISYEKVGIIVKTDAEFSKFVYSYEGSYDVVNQTYTFSDFVLDEEKSSFYLNGSTYCSLEEKEYSYSELKQCNDAVQYVESKKLPYPNKYIIYASFFEEDTLVLDDKTKTTEIHDCI